MKRETLLSYLSTKEKFDLVGSFVVENFWDTFIEQNRQSIDTFRDIAHKSIHLFIKTYQDVWDYVVAINILDDRFLVKCIATNEVFGGLSLNELEILLKLLSLSLYSELEKDCLMALNKTILTELAHTLKIKYNLDDQEFQLLMTPGFETFFTKYHFDHFEYSVEPNLSLRRTLRSALIDNYHANDADLFEMRFANMHFPTGDNLKDLFVLQRKTIAEKAETKKNFIGQNDDLIAFEKLLEYDNFLDFKYRYNLEACPEYYVRKLLFSECQLHGIFVNASKALSLNDEEFILGVKTLLKQVENKYLISIDNHVDFDNILRSEKINQLRIKGSIQAIVENLKAGSPCLISRTEYVANSSNSNLLIIGYEKDVLIAKKVTRDDAIIKLRESDLKHYDQFLVLQKYNESFLLQINKAIAKFIARKPYLNREIYDIAF